MFVVDWIILKKLHVKESKSIIYLYTKDFGKISAWVKESKMKYPIDMGNIINVCINTKWNINQIDSYKIKKTIDYSCLTFGSISSILELLTYLFKLIPEWVPSESIFLEYLDIFEYLEKDSEAKKTVEFFKLKLIIKAWISINSDKSINFKKIFEFSKTNKILKMLQINWIDDQLLAEISSFNKDSYNLYLM